MLLLALGKLSVQSGRQLTPDAQALLSAATTSGAVELQQRALEVQALLRWAGSAGGGDGKGRVSSSPTGQGVQWASN